MSPTHAERNSAPGRRAVHAPAVLTGYLLLMLAMLAADLGLKAWAFERVAGLPVELVQTVEERDALQLKHGGSRYVILYDDPGRRFAGLPHIQVIPRVLDLRLTTNTGAVFGLGKGARWIFISVSVVAIIVIVALFLRSRADAHVRHVAYALILAGAIGNLHDRLRFAAVRDMLHLFPETDLWPWIFNLADAVLMVGVGLILLTTFAEERRQRTAARPAAAGQSPAA